MMTKIVLLIFTSFFFSANAFCHSIESNKNGIAIPNLDTIQQINATIVTPNNISIGITIESKNGKCIGYVGRSPAAIDFQMPAPCDLMTKGAAQGFSPQFSFASPPDGSIIIRFHVVGELRYFPELRSECSHSWRNVTLLWRNPKNNPTPEISVLPPSQEYDPHKDALHCPRFFYDLKPSHLP